MCIYTYMCIHIYIYIYIYIYITTRPGAAGALRHDLPAAPRPPGLGANYDYCPTSSCCIIHCSNMC